MKKLKPWALGPFELLEHAEGHFKGNSDIDKRLALVSFDNVIEFSIVTYLTLNPIQRNGRIFEKSDVERWQRNFHSKIEFYEKFVTESLGELMRIGRDEIIFFHQLRNELYHNGNGFVPAKAQLDDVREAAIWVFSTLFNTDANDILGATTVPHEALASTNTLDTTSAANFLEISIAIRKSVEILLENLKSNGNNQPRTLIEEWIELTKTAPSEHADSLTPLVQEVDAIRNAIIEGVPLPKNSKDLNSLSESLAKVVEFTDSLLRDHQIAIVEKAMQATINAFLSTENRKVGILRQTAGSRLSLSTTAYAIQARFLPQLSDTHIIVIADRRNLIDQIFEIARQHIDDTSNIRISRPENHASLESCLSSSEPTIIFTTVQLLAQNDFPIDRISLMIGYQLTGVHEKLCDHLAGVTRILFTSTPITPDSLLLDFFGEIIAKYDLKDALDEGFAVPAKYESRCLNRLDYFALKDDELPISKFGGASSKILTEDYLQYLASDIAQHFAVLKGSSEAKGIIIVPDIYTGEKLHKIYCRNSNFIGKNLIVAESIETFSSTNSPLENSELIRKFFDPENPLSLIICTQHRIIGFDIPNLNVIYIATPIAPATCNILMSKVSRIYPGKEFGLIVDYVGLYSNFVKCLES